MRRFDMETSTINRKKLLFPIIFMALVLFFSFHATPVAAATTVYVNAAHGNDSVRAVFLILKKPFWWCKRCKYRRNSVY